MSKLIIGCGYLGTRVAKCWLSAGETIWALTRNQHHAQEFEQLGIKPLLGDLTQPESLPEFPEVDSILYAVGWDRSTGLSQREVYVEGLQSVLPRLEGRYRNFLAISSTSVYGQDDGSWVDENSVTIPLKENGKVCLKAEEILKAFHQKESLSCQEHSNECRDADSKRNAQRTSPSLQILRLAGIYGPARLIARMDQLKSGKPLTGNPNAWLNLIHIDDAVQVVLAVEQLVEQSSSEVWLVCDDQPIRRTDYYKQLAKLINAPAPSFELSLEQESVPCKPNLIDLENAKKNRSHPATRPVQTAHSLNKRCSNRKIHTRLNLTLQWPTIATGLPALVQEDQ